MKNITVKILLSILLCVTVFGSQFHTSVNGKANTKVTFTKKSISAYVGAKKQIKLKNVKGKVKWKIKNKKIAAIVKKQGKYKNQVTIKAKKKGTTKLIATYKGKKYTVKITVKNKTNNKKNDTKDPVVQETTAPEIVTENTEKETMTYTLEEKLKLEVTNSPIMISDDMKIDVRISILTNEHLTTGYYFGKLEKFDGTEWKSVEVNNLGVIDGIGNIMPEMPFTFSIGLNNCQSYTNIMVDNLEAGHYRYSHLMKEGNAMAWISGEFDICNAD